jgi:hypothetical protein
MEEAVRLSGGFFSVALFRILELVKGGPLWTRRKDIRNIPPCHLLTRVINFHWRTR